MNSCVLMARIVQPPQIRYTPDQVAIAEMMVEFEGIGTDAPPSTLKVVGWRNLAAEIEQNYHLGDRVVIEGRLRMNVLEREERGTKFKEKRAELTASRIHKLDSDPHWVASVPKAERPPSNVVSMDSYQAPAAPPQAPAPAREPVPTAAPPPDDRNLDDIPF
jgi:single-strand DNA-binding protein